MMIGNYHLTYTNKTNYLESIKYLRKSLRLNPKNTYSWYLLAKAYAQTDNLPLAEYATAERYYLIGDYEMAHQFTMKSLKNIEKNTTEWYRANDLLNIINNMQLQDS
jgi:Putative Zn-dependent protease, contains TPR repeats